MKALRVHFLEPTLPGSQTRAVWTLALFAAVQLADATMTATGVTRFGPGIEANPLLVFYVTTLGVGAAVAAAKLLAILCATVLHVQTKHLALAILTLGYVLVAVVPWTWTLLQ